MRTNALPCVADFLFSVQFFYPFFIYLDYRKTYLKTDQLQKIFHGLGGPLFRCFLSTNIIFKGQWIPLCPPHWSEIKYVGCWTISNCYYIIVTVCFVFHYVLQLNKLYIPIILNMTVVTASQNKLHACCYPLKTKNTQHRTNSSA